MKQIREVIGLKKKNVNNEVIKKDKGTKGAVVLVIQSDKYDWLKIFKGKILADGRSITPVQCGWQDIIVSAESTGTPLLVHIRNRIGAAKPEFLLIRNEVYTSKDDFRTQLFGFMYASIPSINNLQSIYNFCERPIIFAELIKLSKKYGDAFPLIKQEYFASQRGMMWGGQWPVVAKVGHAHAGQGKMKVMSYRDIDDFKSVLAMTSMYCTLEPYYEGKYDLRIQKIGTHYRCFKRMSVSGNWKTNTGSSHIEEITITEEYKRWADLSSEMFGGLDILTVDAIHTIDDKEYILEVNGGSSGLCPTVDEEDNGHIADLVISKLDAIFATSTAKSSTSTATPSTSIPSETTTTTATSSTSTPSETTTTTATSSTSTPSETTTTTTTTQT